MSMPILVEHPHFRPWLVSLSGAVAAKVVDGMEYLREHGRQAVLPDVRHHLPDMSEVRADQLVGGRPLRDASAGVLR